MYYFEVDGENVVKYLISSYDKKGLSMCLMSGYPLIVSSLIKKLLIDGDMSVIPGILKEDVSLKEYFTMDVVEVVSYDAYKKAVDFLRVSCPCGCDNKISGRDTFYCSDKEEVLQYDFSFEVDSLKKIREDVLDNCSDIEEIVWENSFLSNWMIVNNVESSFQKMVSSPLVYVIDMIIEGNYEGALKALGYVYAYDFDEEVKRDLQDLRELLERLRDNCFTRPSKFSFLYPEMDYSKKDCGKFISRLKRSLEVTLVGSMSMEEIKYWQGFFDDNKKKEAYSLVRVGN